MKSIRSKIFLGFATISLFMIAQSVVTYYFVAKNNALVLSVIGGDFRASTDIAKIAIEGQKMRRYEKEYFIYVDNQKKRDKYGQEWHDAATTLRGMLDNVQRDQSGAWSTRDKITVGTWRSALDTYKRYFDHLVSDVNRGRITDTLQANAAIQDGKNAFRVLLGGAAKGGDEKFQLAKAARQTIESNTRVLNYLVVGIAASSIGLALLFMFLIPNAIARPIKSLNKAAEEISMGDLDRSVPTSGVSEFRQLAGTLERMRISQKTMLIQLHKT